MLGAMETWYDMHCHVGFTPDAAATARAGGGAGISALSCTVSPGEYERLASTLAEVANVRVALGAHPWWVADGRIGEAELEAFCALAPAVHFIGEIGLDFAGPRDTPESRALQTAALKRMLAACDEKTPAAPSAVGDAPGNAAATNAPGAAPAALLTPAAPKLVSLHAVNSAGAVLDLLEEVRFTDRHQVIFHWFSGTSDDLRRALRAGCFFSVGPRMLASRRGREYARQIPLDRLLLETDMPAHAGEPLPPNLWRAELDNALAGIAQLKRHDRATTLDILNATSISLLA